jgi:hypothetical protein
MLTDERVETTQRQEGVKTCLNKFFSLPTLICVSFDLPREDKRLPALHALTSINLNLKNMFEIMFQLKVKDIETGEEFVFDDKVKVESSPENPHGAVELPAIRPDIAPLPGIMAFLLSKF